jgi:D-alanine-D-alanine ligase
MGALRHRGLVFDDHGALGSSGAVGRRPGRPLGRVGIVYGGPSPEHDVSILTGLQAVRGLSGTSHVGEVCSLYWSKAGEWFEVPTGLEASAFAQGRPDEARPLRLSAGPGGGYSGRRSGRFASKDEPLELDALVICCHGGPGEDGTLQGVFDLVGIPYTGPTPAGALLGMDKLLFGALAASARLQTLPRVTLSEGGRPPDFGGPYIVKPRFGGSSIGIEVVADYETARARLSINSHLRRGAVLEPYRPELFDLQVGARTWPEVELSAIERPLRSHTGGEILGYSDKYVGPEGMTTAPREMPALVSAEVERQIRSTTLALASLAGLRGVARIDFLSDGENAYLNEINTIPGSLARYLWIEPPLSFAELLADMLGEALARPAASYSVAGADGSLLRGAGSISSKLG